MSLHSCDGKTNLEAKSFLTAGRRHLVILCGPALYGRPGRVRNVFKVTQLLSGGIAAALTT